MSRAELMWECSCGHTEYSSIEPEECLKCGNISNFMQMPEEIVNEREKEISEDAIESPIKKSKSSTKKGKVKSTKSKRSKK